MLVHPYREGMVVSVFFCTAEVSKVASLPSVMKCNTGTSNITHCKFSSLYEHLSCLKASNYCLEPWVCCMPTMNSSYFRNLKLVLFWGIQKYSSSILFNDLCDRGRHCLRLNMNLSPLSLFSTRDDFPTLHRCHRQIH